jgi:hypothetical protein
MSGVNSWCILRSSGKVKAAIKYKMEKGSLKVKDLAKVAGVRAYRIRDYLEQIHEGGKPSITQFQLMSICKELGIEVKLNVSFD